MTDLVLDASAEVVVAVCGEQASGKTVFLTCIFQSIWTACPDDVALDFDRTKIGNASYFQGIEDSLITSGSIPGTIDRALYPARIYIRPYDPIPGPPRSLAVDVVDFAGRHFRSIADLKNLLDESDAEDMKTMREVNETLERADAFVVLLNSQEIDPLNLTPKRNPFSPSVNFILNRCHVEKKPVALLFSQADQTPLLTDVVVQSMPRVLQFRRFFTEDLHEAASPNGRPYGVVRRISCYETVAEDLLPKKQDVSGNIWRPEPAQIVLDLIRAALPAIAKRIADKALKDQEDRDNQLLEERRKRQLQWSLAAAAILVFLTLAGVAAMVLYKRSEMHKLAIIERMTMLVRDGTPVLITPADEAILAETLDTLRASPPDSHGSSRLAVRDLESTLAATGQRFAAAPLFNIGYSRNLARYEMLSAYFEAGANTALLSLLDARREFLSRWFIREKKGRPERTRDLDAAAQTFAGDPEFSALLRTQSTKEKEAEIAGWKQAIDADPDVATRLATIQRLLAAALREDDAEFISLARRALAGHVVSTLLEHSENDRLRDKLIAPLVPDLAKFQDGEIRFDVLARDLLDCTTQDQCEQRAQVVQSVLNDATTAAANSQSAVENTLRTLMLDLPREERRQVWGVVAEAINRSYFFSRRSDAWPDGVRSLDASVAAWAAADRDWTVEVIAQLAARSLYATELEYLENRLSATEIRRRMVSIYSTILDALADQTVLLPADDLAEVSRKASTSLAGRESNNPLAEIAGELSQVLSLVQSVNLHRSRGADDELTSSRLENFLRSAKRGHCGALGSHGAPTECVDAA